WTRIHIDDSMSSAQYAAFEKIFPVAFAGFNRLARNKARVPLSISRTDSTISFSVPESRVEMKLMAGLDDSPIMINGLPNPAYHDYVQYESVVHRHESTDSSWSYEGTNGFTSVMRASGWRGIGVTDRAVKIRHKLARGAVEQSGDCGYIRPSHFPDPAGRGRKL